MNDAWRRAYVFQLDQELTESSRLVLQALAFHRGPKAAGVWGALWGSGGSWGAAAPPKNAAGGSGRLPPNTRKR